MNEHPTQDAFGYFHELPTRWSDCDMLGHINNARYFTFDESARLAYFDELIGGSGEFWKRSGFILARIECDFISQVHHPALVKFGFRIRRIGRSSMDTEGGMFIDGRLAAITRGVLVWFDYQNNRSTPVPDAARAFIRAREKVTPDENR